MLSPGQTKEIGLLEANWQFEPNEVIEITHGTYRPARYATYKTDRGEVGIKESWW